MKNSNRSIRSVAFIIPVVLAVAAWSTGYAASKEAAGWQQLADRAEIQNLVAAALFAYDRKDGEGFAKYFVPEGELITVASKMHPDAGVTYKGPERLAFFVTKNERGRAEFGVPASGAATPPGAAPATGAAAPPGNGVMHHIATSDHIRFTDATHAKHLGYWMTSSGGFAGVYDDDLTKVNGKWMLSVRRILYTPLNPDAN